MTRQTRSIDFTMLRRARRILGITLASAALGAPLVPQAQSTPPPTAQTKAGDQAAADAFKRADVNRDGKISKDEAAGLPALAAKFDELDKDKDGSLSMAEYMAGQAMAK